MIEASSAVSLEVTDIEENIFINLASSINLNFKQCQEKCQVTRCNCFRKDVCIVWYVCMSGAKGMINRSSNENMTHMSVLVNVFERRCCKNFQHL